MGCETSGDELGKISYYPAESCNKKEEYIIWKHKNTDTPSTEISGVSEMLNEVLKSA